MWNGVGCQACVWILALSLITCMTLNKIFFSLNSRHEVWQGSPPLSWDVEGGSGQVNSTKLNVLICKMGVITWLGAIWNCHCSTILTYKDGNIFFFWFHQILTLENDLCKVPGQWLVSTQQMEVSCLRKTFTSDPRAPQRDGVAGRGLWPPCPLIVENKGTGSDCLVQIH